VLPESELEMARKAMSENQYRQEFLCDFSASSEDVLISLDLAQDASSKTYHNSVYMHAPLIMGLDVARFGDDKSVFIYRRGIVAYGLSKVRDYDTMRLADLAAAKITHDKPDGVFVDEVGIGAGVIDRLRQLGFKISSVNGGSKASDENAYLNKRAETWVKMRDWLKDGGAIPDDQELKSDLVSLRYSYDNRQRYVLEKKEDMKKRGLPSPDCADALAMTFAYPVHAKTELDIQQERFDTSAEDYDPLHAYRGSKKWR
ncbi:MAG: terminase, partial [Candidatus Omnitrophica bacterium]|nr:terminase [Candidatus Omnitrophota bacterium]